MKPFKPKLLAHQTHLTQQSQNRPNYKPINSLNFNSTPKASFNVMQSADLSGSTDNHHRSALTAHNLSAGENNHKNSRKSLIIDINSDGPTFNIQNQNRISPYTTTNSATYGNSKYSKTAASFNFNAPLTVKASKPIDFPYTSTSTSSALPPKSFENARLITSPKQYPNQPTTTQPNRVSSVSASGTLDMFFNQLSPKNMHLRSASSKSPLNAQRPNPGSAKFGDAILAMTSQEQQNGMKDNSKNPQDSSNSVHISKVFDEHIMDGAVENERAEYDGENGLEFIRSNTNFGHSHARRPPMPIPNHEPTKCSIKRNGVVKAYAANTNQGIIRNYNEDRVSIILNITKPASRMNEEWPKCSFFGVYDGHGGVSCADFLRDNLHQFVIKEPSFPSDPKEAIAKGFEAAENAFLAFAESQPELDKSGSCAIVTLIVGETCYIANVGDSRAVLSSDGGSKIYSLSYDHKPSEEGEQKRIIENGGRIYQTQSPIFRANNDGTQGNKGQVHYILGPHRVYPGRLSVSRTFGDIEAKLTKYGGRPNVVSATPEIKSFKINHNHDFILLGCDGIFDKLTSKDTVVSAWESAMDRAQDIHHQCGLAVEEIMRESINRRTLDNITVVFIGLKNFKTKLFPKKKQLPVSNENFEKQFEKTVSHTFMNERAMGHHPNQKLESRPLQERGGNAENIAKGFNEQTYSKYSEEQAKKLAGFLRETHANLSSNQPRKKSMEKEQMYGAKYVPYAMRKSPTNMEKKPAKHDENYKNDEYFDYLQHGKMPKGKSLDYRNSDSFKFGVKGELKSHN